MKLVALLAVTVLVFGTVGCVSKKKYQEAQDETQFIRTELEKAQSQSRALEQQLELMKEQNKKLTSETEMASSELQRLKESGNQELARFDEDIADLQDKMNVLSTQHRSLREEYDAVKRRNEQLKTTVARYQKELAGPKPSDNVKPPPPKPSVTSSLPPPPPLASMPQEAKTAPRPALPAPPPQTGWLDTIKRWLLALWHWFF